MTSIDSTIRSGNPPAGAGSDTQGCLSSSLRARLLVGVFVILLNEISHLANRCISASAAWHEGIRRWIFRATHQLVHLLSLGVLCILRCQQDDPLVSLSIFGEVEVRHSDCDRARETGTSTRVTILEGDGRITYDNWASH